MLTLFWADGQKVAVVQNEFGEISIDDELISSKFEGKDEEIIVTNSGCLCCTVRGDLIDIFNKQLLPKMKEIDHVCKIFPHFVISQFHSLK